MTDQELLIELEPDDTQGPARLRVTDDEGWLKERLARDPSSNRFALKAIDGDVEGHALSSTVTLRAYEDEDDTEGHAISVHFPSRTEADAFRRRLMITGVLAGTIAAGAAAGIGLQNMQGQGAADAATVTSGAAGMDWSQAERPGTATGGDDASDLQTDKGRAAPR